ncbi:MAG: hypothetical protein KF901_28055 [Myxococcales bacterium]|nr:hypothetical protein [Myxococcales bacterium]
MTVETRAAEYPSRPKAHRMRIARKVKLTDDPGGAGYEIAREARACARCAADFETIRSARELVAE